MHNAPPPPKCSKCGRIDARPISKKYDYLPGLGPWNAEPIATTYTYLCACGAAFTRSVKSDPPKAKA